MINEIGGYFELEISTQNAFPHNKATAVNSGRNALSLILKELKIKKLLLPFYSCDVLLQAMDKVGVTHEFYKIDSDFNPIIPGKPRKNTAVLYINYFGLMEAKSKSLAQKYENLIIDNSQAFFADPFNASASFYSPRKFFGVPDGGYLYLKQQNTTTTINEKECAYNRCEHLLKRIELGAEKGYKAYKENEAYLDRAPVRKISSLSDKILKGIDYSKVKENRISNFRHLHSALAEFNEFPIDFDKASNVPMIYPFLRKGNESIREKLIKRKIYVARYWENVIDWVDDESSIETYLTKNLIPLPIDQRYGSTEMNFIIEAVRKILK